MSDPTTLVFVHEKSNFHDLCTVNGIYISISAGISWFFIPVSALHQEGGPMSVD